MHGSRCARRSARAFDWHEGMKLLRVAAMYFAPAPDGWDAWEIKHGRCTVSTLAVKGSPPPDGQKRILVTAQVASPEAPEIGPDGLLTPPAELRRECEGAIEAAASIISVLTGSARRISSPFPPLAFVAESDAERAHLSAASGIRSRNRACHRPRFSIPVSRQVLDGLVDRLDGVALVADFLAQDHAMARYREGLRFLELAFGLPAVQLEKKLSQFLSSSDAGYSRPEVATWLSLRHSAVHADRAETTNLTVEADVRPFMARMEQAIVDVLLNKAKWHEPSRTRRSLFTPPAVTTGPDGGLRIIERSLFTLESQLLDPFGAYPVDLSACLSAPPPEWWCPFGSEQAVEQGVGADEPQL